MPIQPSETTQPLGRILSILGHVDLYQEWQCTQAQLSLLDSVSDPLAKKALSQQAQKYRLQIDALLMASHKYLETHP